MITLSFGFKKPVTGDKGTVFWPALEDDITQLNAHTHNGTNSSLLTSASINSLTQNVSAAGWVATSGGQYRQVVTMPGTTLYDNYFMVYRDQTTKEQLFLATEKISSNTFYVYTNDNSLAITVYHLS